MRNDFEFLFFAKTQFSSSSKIGNGSSKRGEKKIIKWNENKFSYKHELRKEYRQDKKKHQNFLFSNNFQTKYSDDIRSKTFVFIDLFMCVVRGRQTDVSNFCLAVCKNQLDIKY